MIFSETKFIQDPKKFFFTNKTNDYHTDDTWNLDIIDLTNYSPESNKDDR